MKKIILVPALLGVMGIGGLIAVTGGNLVGSASELTIDQIKEEALEEVNGTIREVEVEHEGNKKYYEIEVVTDDAEYDLKIDATTGELIKKHRDDLDKQKQVFNNNVSVNQSNNQQDAIYEKDYHDNINENDDKDDQNSNTNTNTQTRSQLNVKTEQKQTTSIPAEELVINSDVDNDSYDDDRYDDDRYDDDDDDDDDDRYDDHDDDDNDD